MGAFRYHVTREAARNVKSAQDIGGFIAKVHKMLGSRDLYGLDRFTGKCFGCLSCQSDMPPLEPASPTGAERHSPPPLVESRSRSQSRSDSPPKRKRKGGRSPGSGPTKTIEKPRRSNRRQ